MLPEKSIIVPSCSVIRSKQFDNDQTALISGKNLKTHDTVAKIKACDSIRLILLLFCWFLHYLIAMTSPTRVKEGVISTSSSMVVKRHSGFTFFFVLEKGQDEQPRSTRCTPSFQLKPTKPWSSMHPF